jgi:hypothetical protein
MLEVSVAVGNGVMVGKKLGVKEGVRVGVRVSVKTKVKVGGMSCGCNCSGCDNTMVVFIGDAAGAEPGTGIVSTQADDTRVMMIAIDRTVFLLSMYDRNRIA